MDTDGLGRKALIVAAAVAGILLVLRILGGRGSEALGGDGIDRVDTGRSAEDREGGPVETGLERVSTDEEAESVPADGGEVGTDDEDTGGEEVPVEATGGRFDDLDLFDYVAIAGAAVDAAREEYRNRI